jgi:nucleotidyltransferase/DNA polymerase involved in DNA repair
MSILYCAIPHFAAALARRDRALPAERPLVLIDPDDRVLDASAEAASVGVMPGLPAQTARVRCPEAALIEADIPRCREAFESLLVVLERFGPSVEPHGWAGAYVDVGDTIYRRQDAVPLCAESGRAVRDELGKALQPALGWDTGKFTAQAAAQRTRPGRLLAVEAMRESDFLSPLPVRLLPLERDALQRLQFLGLRTLGQYAALPTAAVWQQFGRSGVRAQCCARGQDDRPIVPRHKTPVLSASHDFEMPVIDRQRLRGAIEHAAAPLLAELRGNLQACGRVRLTVWFDAGSAVERTRAFLIPTADEAFFLRTLDDLLDQIHWPAGTVALSLTLEEIQDAVIEQLSLLPSEDEREVKLDAVRRYLAARFGVARLRRAALVQPGAPLAEWRVGWRGEGGE